MDIINQQEIFLIWKKKEKTRNVILHVIMLILSRNVRFLFNKSMEIAKIKIQM